jgi:phosphoglycerol transferase MdoB-like AlkP superfamily enzyme
MKQKIIGFISVFLTWIIIFMLQKPFFMLICKSSIGNYSLSDVFLVMYHGLPLDMSMAGYLSLLPSLLIAVSIWTCSKWLKAVWKFYFAIASLLVSATFSLNIGLYPYWKFPLDSTPLFYFFSSPADAMASITFGMLIAGIAALVAVAFVIYLLFQSRFYIRFLDCRTCNSNNIRKIIDSVVIVLLTALLIVPIRGGFSVSSTNTGKAYFSERMSLNHSAVNPFFSLMESVSHENDFASQYRFMDDAEAEKLFRQMVYTSSNDSVKLLNTSRPDIYIFVLESFSRHVMQTEATPNMVKLSHEGVFFDNFYANSFRTDRGLVAILSGYPAQPTMSIMKYPQKTNQLPSIARKLHKEGYDLKYFYGGDADFTNMRSYLTSQGFTDIISDVDFPVDERMSKWGVPDGPVVDRLISSLKMEKSKRPLLRVLQTSSSHEPYDVPWNKMKNPILNAFNYADAQVGHFVSWLKKSGRWERSLVILVPDHLGCWPENFSNFTFDRYEIPMIWIGGAVAKAQKVSTLGSQQDIAATLLGQMGIEHKDMLFSKDMLDSKAPHFAFFTVPDAFGMVTEDNRIIFDNKSRQLMLNEGKHKGKNLKAGQAYLQKIYDDIALR